MKTVRTNAIVLRRTNYGEADRVVQLLTPEGRRAVMAKGVRREKSRLAGGIELFAICDVVIGEGKGDLGILTSARLVQFYGKIMQDYDRMQFAYTAIKLIGKASDQLNEPEWYEVLSEVLMGLDALLIDLRLVQTWFYLRYAGLLGHELSLYHDMSGVKLAVDTTYRYDETDQGLREVARGEITSEHIKFLRLVATKPLKSLAQIGGLDAILSDCLLLARQHAAV